MKPENRNERVYVARSKIHGHGLFAARPFSAGDLIGTYEGPVVQTDGPHVLWVESGHESGWTGYDGRNEMRFMNHSDQPNAEMDGLLCYALCNIQTGAEITLDYGWDES